MSAPPVFLSLTLQLIEFEIDSDKSLNYILFGMTGKQVSSVSVSLVTVLLDSW